MAYQVTPQDVSDAASSCTTAAGNIEGQLATLQSYVVSMEGWWHCIASNTFQEMMDTYNLYSAMLHTALTDMATGLSTNFSNYQDSETANINSINVINSELGLPAVNLN